MKWVVCGGNGRRPVTQVISLLGELTAGTFHRFSLFAFELSHDQIFPTEAYHGRPVTVSRRILTVNVVYPFKREPGHEATWCRLPVLIWG